MVESNDIRVIQTQNSDIQSLIDSLKNQIKESTTQVIEKYKQDLKIENQLLVKQIEYLKCKLAENESYFSKESKEMKNMEELYSQGKEMIVSDKITPEPSKTKSEKKAKQPKPESTSGDKSSSKTGGASNDAEIVDVRRLDFRIGKILSVEKHPDADSLYVEKVDIGEDQPRTVVSGLVKHVTPQELEGRFVVLLCNLKPAKMRGVVSEAMVMCASTPEKVEVLNPPSGCLPGDVITFEGYPRAPDSVLNPKKKIFEQLSPDLTTNGDKIATYKGVPFVVEGKGQVIAKSLANVQVK